MGGGGGLTDPSRLRRHVAELAGPRHPVTAPGRLAEALGYVEGRLEASGLEVRREPFRFRGREHHNLVASLGDPGADAREVPRVLVGAHVDSVRGTPGADDNASGVAGLLEVARSLAGEGLGRTVELVVFNLEERQGLTYRVGSRRYAAGARRRGVEYAGVLILEMIGYRTEVPGSQRIPLPIRWMDLPRTGHFIAAVGDGGSRSLVRRFEQAASAAAPGLDVVTLTVPFRGWPVWATRRSDNASFWSKGYPAVLVTDTADLRNPHYHRATDVPGTLDYDFMASVTDSVVETVRRLAQAGG